MPSRKNAAYVTEAFSSTHNDYVSPHSFLVANAGTPAPQIHLVGGDLYLNNQIVPEVKWDRNIASWHHGTSSPNDLSSGMLYFAPDRSWFTGHVTAGSLADASKRTTTEVRGSVAPSVYSCEVSAHGFDTIEAATEAATAESTKYETEGVPPIEYGVQWDENGKPSWLFKIAGQDFTPDTTQKIDKDYQTVITLGYNSDVVSIIATEGVPPNPPYPLVPADGTFTIHWDGKYLWGYSQRYDQATNSPSTKYYAFRGTLQASVLRANFTPALKHEPYKALALAQEAPLSVDDLRGLTSSDLALQTRVNELMVIAMKYSIDEEWLRDIFGETRPDINKLPYMADSVKSDGGKQFYGVSFFDPYLGSGLNQLQGPGAPKRKMTKEEANKVQYFLSTGLAKDTNYSSQNQYAYLQAYVDTQPRIQKYLADQLVHTNKTYWADQLYDSINTDAVINQLANQIVYNADFTLTKRYSILLQVLGRPEYASTISTTVASNALTKSANNASGQSIIDIFPDVLAAFITEYNTDPGKDAPKDQINRYEAAQALKQAADFIGSVAALGDAFAELFVTLRSQGSTIITTITNVMKDFTVKYPRLSNAMSYLGKAFTVVAWAAAVYTLVQGWANWKTINVTQKIALVARTIQFAGEFALVIPDIGKAIAKGAGFVWEAAGNFIDVIRRIGAWIGSTRVGSLIGDALSYAWQAIGGPRFVNWVTSLAEWLAENVFRRIGNVINVTGTLLEGLYDWAAPLLKGFLKGIGPLVAAAAAAAALYTFIKDLQDNAPTITKALDGCLAVISILEVIVAVAALFIESVVLAAVGVILALAAVIIALVQIFDPPPPPPSPAEQFQNNVFFPWLAKQADPPSDWTPPTPPPTSAYSN